MVRNEPQAVVLHVTFNILAADAEEKNLGFSGCQAYGYLSFVLPHIQKLASEVWLLLFCQCFLQDSGSPQVASFLWAPLTSEGLAFTAAENSLWFPLPSKWPASPLSRDGLAFQPLFFKESCKIASVFKLYYSREAALFSLSIRVANIFFLLVSCDVKQQPNTQKEQYFFFLMENNKRFTHLIFEF